MSDIVERLRYGFSEHANPAEHIELEAADEIERLRALAPDLVKQNGVLAKEIERLQAALDASEQERCKMADTTMTQVRRRQDTEAEIERLRAKVDRLMGRKPIYWD